MSVKQDLILVVLIILSVCVKTSTSLIHWEENHLPVSLSWMETTLLLVLVLSGQSSNLPVHESHP